MYMQREGESVVSPGDNDDVDDHWSLSRLSTTDNISASASSSISVSPISDTNVGIVSANHIIQRARKQRLADRLHVVRVCGGGVAGSA